MKKERKNITLGEKILCENRIQRTAYIGLGLYYILTFFDLHSSLFHKQFSLESLALHFFSWRRSKYVNTLTLSQVFGVLN